VRILFITSNRVGDAVLSTGLLAWLQHQHPKARFTIACGPYAADLFRAAPNLERLIILKKKTWNRHWLGLWAACASTKWDIILDLRNSAVSRLLFAKKRYFGVRRPGQHKVAENAAALHLMTPPAPHIWLDARAKAAAAQILPAARPLLALGPAANWPAKQWPVERFAELAQRLTDASGPLPHAPVLIIADEREREQIAPLLNALPPSQRVEILGHDLLTVAACLAEARLFIGNDSGLMHIAAAMNVPTLGLFGPGYEEIYGPWGARTAWVRTEESREELLARLPHPAAHHPNLMQGLSVDKAFGAALALLQRTNR